MIKSIILWCLIIWNMYRSGRLLEHKRINVGIRLNNKLITVNVCITSEKFGPALLKNHGPNLVFEWLSKCWIIFVHWHIIINYYLSQDTIIYKSNHVNSLFWNLYRIEHFRNSIRPLCNCRYASHEITISNLPLS